MVIYVVVNTVECEVNVFLCYVAGVYALGKESLLLELAMEFKTWIEVSFERMETLKALELPDVFTTDPGAGRIRAVNQSEICYAALCQWNKEQPTLAISPTSRQMSTFHPNFHLVPYSDHSSYQELEDFVSALKPTTLVPIVGNCVPESLSNLLPSKKRHEILVPESVRHYMLKQPESHHSSSAFTSLRRRHFQPLAPKGVVFESPVRASRVSCEEAWEVECVEQDDSEEEMDTESSEKESDCILIDLSKEVTPSNDRTGAGDMWSLNIVQTVSEGKLMAESVPLSQLTQSNFAQMDILTNTRACLKPVRITRASFETEAKIGNETGSSENCNQQSKRGDVQNKHILSDGFNQDNDTMLDDNNTSQHSRHGTSHNNSVRLSQSSPDNSSCPSSSYFSQVWHESVEESENSILKFLPFTEEDLKTWGLLEKSFLKQFPVSPLNNTEKRIDG